MSPRIAEKNRFTIDDTGAYLSDSAVAIIPKKVNKYFLVGLLNSKLLEAYITDISPYVQGKYYNYSKSYVEKLPIKIPTNTKEEKLSETIIERVKEILRLKKKDENADTRKLEDDIDEMVFDLYGITTDERNVIIAS